MGITEAIARYIQDLREYFEQKLIEMEMFQDRQAQEIEELTDKLMALGTIAVILVIVIIVLIILLSVSRKRKKRRKFEEREEELFRREEELRREEQRLRELRQNENIYSDRVTDDSAAHRSRYGKPSRREYGGRQNDKAMRESSNRETVYYNNDDWL